MDQNIIIGGLLHDTIEDTTVTKSDIKNKYGTLWSAKNTIHHYEQTVRERIEATSTTDPVLKATIEVDKTTYDNLAEGSRKIVYYYDWEVERNEDKREIKLIDPRYAADILAEQSERLK